MKLVELRLMRSQCFNLGGINTMSMPIQPTSSIDVTSSSNIVHNVQKKPTREPVSSTSSDFFVGRFGAFEMSPIPGLEFTAALIGKAFTTLVRKIYEVVKEFFHWTGTTSNTEPTMSSPAADTNRRATTSYPESAQEIVTPEGPITAESTISSQAVLNPDTDRFAATLPGSAPRIVITTPEGESRDFKPDGDSIERIESGNLPLIQETMTSEESINAEMVSGKMECVNYITKQAFEFNYEWNVKNDFISVFFPGKDNFKVFLHKNLKAKLEENPEKRKMLFKQILIGYLDNSGKLIGNNSAANFHISHKDQKSKGIIDGKLPKITAYLYEESHDKMRVRCSDEPIYLREESLKNDMKKIKTSLPEFPRRSSRIENDEKGNRFLVFKFANREKREEAISQLRSKYGMFQEEEDQPNKVGNNKLRLSVEQTVVLHDHLNP